MKPILDAFHERGVVMREILFRGKSIQKNSWVYGYYIELLKPRILDAKMTKDQGSAGDWIYKVSAVDPATVGQYTGLDDKNGHKIFEGDVVEFQYRKKAHKGIVEIQRGAAFVRNKVGVLDDHLHVMICFRPLEVIGNIHDNPELMGS